MSDNEAFVKSVQDATLKIIEQVAGNVEGACLLLEREAKKNCPVDQGFLRASITHEVEVTGTAIMGYIGSNLEIAPYVHNGTGIYAEDGNGRKTPWTYCVKAGKYKGFHITVGQRPQPFLKNAVFNNREKVERILAK